MWREVVLWHRGIRIVSNNAHKWAVTTSFVNELDKVREGGFIKIEISSVDWCSGAASNLFRHSAKCAQQMLTSCPEIALNDDLLTMFHVVSKHRRWSIAMRPSCHGTLEDRNLNPSHSHRHPLLAFACNGLPLVRMWCVYRCIHIILKEMHDLLHCP